MLIKHIFHALSHDRHKVVGPVEQTRVEDYETHVRCELLGVVIARVERVEVWFCDVGRGEFALDGRKIHG